MTERVLQRESISLLLFTLFIADIESKTKIVSFNRSGDIRKERKISYFCDSTHIGITNEMNYLGVTFRSSSLELSVADNAIKKARKATGTVLPIRVTSKSDTWGTKLKLHKCLTIAFQGYASEEYEG